MECIICLFEIVFVIFPLCTSKMKENEGTTRQFRKGLVAFVVIWVVCRQVLMSFCIKWFEGREKGRTFAASKPINNCSVRRKNEQN